MQTGTRYARMEGDKLMEIIEPFFDVDGREVPMAERFHPDVVATLVPYVEG